MMTINDIIDGLDSDKVKYYGDKLCFPSAPLPRERIIQ